MDNPFSSELVFVSAKDDPCPVQRAALVQLWHDIQNGEDTLNIDPHVTSRLLGLYVFGDIDGLRPPKKEGDEVWTETYIPQHIFNFHVEFDNLRGYFYECPYKCAESILEKAKRSNSEMIFDDDKCIIITHCEDYILTCKRKFETYFGGDNAVNLAEAYLDGKGFSVEQICRIQNLYHELLFGHRDAKALQEFVAIQEDFERFQTGIRFKNSNKGSMEQKNNDTQVDHTSLGEAVSCLEKNEFQGTCSMGHSHRM